MKTLLIIMLIAVTNQVSACGTESNFEFGGFSTDGRNHTHGESVEVKNKIVTLDTSFLVNLEKNPIGKELQKNREELFYLIASGNQAALNVGIKVFINLLLNPEYFHECDSKHEAWGKEEVAFVISRNLDFHEMLCNFNPEEWDLVSNYFKENPNLWGMIYDPAWSLSRGKTCEIYDK